MAQKAKALVAKTKYLSEILGTLKVGEEIRLLKVVF